MREALAEFQKEESVLVVSAVQISGMQMTPLWCVAGPYRTNLAKGGKHVAPFQLVQ